MASGLSLQEIFFTARFDGKGAIAGIKKFSKQLKGLNKPINSLNKSFSSLFKVAGIAGLTAMTLNAAKLGREMGLISRKTGIAVENISSMQNAFAASGGDAKEISRTLDRITTGLARVSTGDASFTSALSAINISAWDSYGRLKNAEKIRLEMADWIKQQLDAGRTLAEVSTFMSDNFQMSQAEVEHLSVGSAKLLEIQKKYNNEIGVLEKKESDSLNSINNSISKLRATVGVTFDKLIAETAPIIETTLSGIQDMVKFIQDHKDFFGPILEGLAAFTLALKALPVLFTAISAHPLVIAALASMAAGYAVGGGLSDPKTEQQNATELLQSGNNNLDIVGAYSHGFISDYQLNLAHAQGKISDEQYDKALKAKSKNGSILDIYERLPEAFIENEEGNLLDLSQIPLINEGGDNTNVEANVTNNFYGDVDKQQVADGVLSGIKVGIGATPAFNGGRIR